MPNIQHGILRQYPKEIIKYRLSLFVYFFENCHEVEASASLKLPIFLLGYRSLFRQHCFAELPEVLEGFVL